VHKGDSRSQGNPISNGGSNKQQDADFSTGPKKIQFDAGVCKRLKLE